MYELEYCKRCMSCTTACCRYLKAQEKPNIVVILADDLASNEISCYGGKNLKTPNIDRIAEEGIRFTNNFASCAMSVPIRASLYTGLYPARHGSYQIIKYPILI